jgi:hypothetical protein
MDEITIEGKVYISSKQAAKITGYAKDYVGQLCREGRVEARHIGRNWYVLEDAIREHRFGKPAEAKQGAEPEEAAPTADRVSTWQKPQYVPEAPVFVPSLAPKPPAETPVSTPAIADMQSAWKEWFEEKKPQPALPDDADDFKDEYLPVLSPDPHPIAEEEPVTIERIRETPHEEEEEESVAVHRSYDSRSTGEQIPASFVPVVDLSPEHRLREQKKERRTEEKGSWNGVYRSLLLVIAIASALVALIGTGNAEQLFEGTSLDFGVQKTIVDFLGGKSTYESSL